MLLNVFMLLNVVVLADGIAHSSTRLILCITVGAFRLVRRLFSQIERILEINSLREITPGVVDAARQSLGIGTA
ncbi:MAG: hypothetical protein IT305_12990 [Chloroflexi bacterium]|nr:hypothetical protein [Chloroflexota bacterium]